MRMLRDSVAEVTMALKKHKKNKGQAPLVCAVPLRGCGFEMLFGFFRKETFIMVSVPLRGCGFEMGSSYFCFRESPWFPSPCGDVVLKLLGIHEAGDSVRLVSVPLRGCGFEIGQAVFIFSGLAMLFPSPCGDVVLKSLRLGALCRAAQNSVLRRGSDSRPFRCDSAFQKQRYHTQL